MRADGCFDSGGAIQSSFANSKIQILDCKFRNNFASFGGGVYFGDYHDGITLESAVFTNNTAEYGAGVYVTQFNSIVQFTDVVFEENAAIKDGGAIFMLAKDSTFTRNRIVRNVASSGGGMLYGGDSFIMTACVVEENYGLSGKFGGIILELMTSTTILFTLFRANRGNAGGALSIIDCKNVTIHNCTFDANESREAHGGAIFAVQSNAVVSATVFGSNTAKIDGGAIYANSANNFTTSKCVFLGNSAKSGSGSAEWMSGLFNAHVIDNIYSGNDALFGGGTVYWAVSSGMSEPPNILTSNHFAGDNAAFYGSDVATDAHLLQVDSSNVYSVTDYESPAPSIVTHVVDFYGQIVRTESAGLIVASILSDAQCYKSTGYVTGGFVEPLVSGTSNFTTLYAYCDPGYDMLVNLTSITGSLLLRNYFKLSFRACVRGEYYGDSVCNLCEEGTYSLTDPLITPLDDLGQQTVCRDCPEGSLGCYGDTITLEEGYWRISDLATTILKCPLAHSCGGGSGHGDLLCRDGYEGMCSMLVRNISNYS